MRKAEISNGQPGPSFRKRNQSALSFLIPPHFFLVDAALPSYFSFFLPHTSLVAPIVDTTFRCGASMEQGRRDGGREKMVPRTVPLITDTSSNSANALEKTTSSLGEARQRLEHPFVFHSGINSAAPLLIKMMD